MAVALVSAKPPTPQAQASKLAVLIKAKDGVPFEEGFARTNAAKAVMASNIMISRAFWTDDYKPIEEAFACWTGTMTAYVEPNTRFLHSKKVERINSIDAGYYIIYTDHDTKLRYLFRIPDQYLGIFNGLLLVEHPGYDLVLDGKKDRIVKPKSEKLVELINDFPIRDGWYLGDTLRDIPEGTETPRYNANARHLHRIGSRVGSIRRAYSCNYDYMRDVFLGDWPSARHGVVVEVSDGNVEQITGEKPSGKVILLPGVTQLPQPTILDPYRELYEEQVKQALRDLFRPDMYPKYPRGY